MIEITNLHKCFGSQVVLDGVSFTVKSGETAAIVGPSGTGKSVLLKIVTGLLSPDAGDVLVYGQSMVKARNAAARRKITSGMGVLFQAAALFDSITLLENVAFPLYYHSNFNRREILERSAACLRDVGLSGCEHYLPGEVSIGMRKRVGIARALVTEPRVVLFDEPNTGLDPQTGQEIYELIAHTQKQRSFTGIVISHEIPEVFQVCNRVIMLYNGRVQEDAEISDFLHSTNPAVRQFVSGAVEGPIVMS